jgi:hypothetical protein
MSSSYGRKTGLGTTGNPIQVLVDGRTDGFKTNGVTVDWAHASLVAVAVETTLTDGTVVKVGDKYIRYGTILAKITASGKYAPSKTGAADGTQTLTRGSCFVVNQTILESDLGSDHPPVFDRGEVWMDRVVTNENVGGATNPTEASFLTAFPGITPKRD